MRIEFLGSIKSSEDPWGGKKPYDIWVNTARFRFDDGREIIIDRDATRWSIYDDSLEMSWRNCYIYDPKNETYDYSVKAKDLEGATLLALDIEDEAPMDYELEIAGWRAYD